MYKFSKDILLKLLKVPPEPTDPFGKEDHVKVFRASRNYLKYKLIVWAIGNAILGIAGAIGLIILHVFAIVEAEAGMSVLLHLAGLLGWIILAFIIYIGYLSVRLDYEMRWYKVSDRALRIREGIWFVREMTMTFANIQNISITQGPIQRYFGISDLKVQSAGGGGELQQQQQQGQQGFQMHLAYFRGVDNAEEIRNLIRTHLQHIKGSGLGDQEEVEEEETFAVVSSEGAVPSNTLLEELSALKDEAKAFRGVAERLSR